MSLTAPEILRVVDEIRSQIVGSVVSRVVETPLWAVLLYLDLPNGELTRLLVSANDDFSRLHPLTARVRQPKPPLPFGATLHRHLEGQTISAIEVKQDDRVVTLRFGNNMSLVAELTGRNSNLLFADADNTVTAMLRRNRSTRRKLSVGEPYEAAFAPPAQKDMHTVEPGLVDQCPRFSEAVQQQYHPAEHAFELQRLGGRLVTEQRRRIKKNSGRLKAAYNDLKKAEAYTGQRHLGDLLSAHYHLIKRGQESIEVTDYETGQPVKIDLDPATSPQANLDRIYKRARKGERGEEKALERIETLEAEADRLATGMERLQEELEGRPGLEAMEDLARTLGLGDEFDKQQRRGLRAVAAGRKRAKEGLESKFRQYRAANGDIILVGRDARNNSKLTFGNLKSEDVWLHVAGTSGPHVAVPRRGGVTTISDETLKDAALLAAWWSGVKPGGEAEVTWARRKDLRHPGKHAKPGMVLVSHPRYITVIIEEDRLQRLRESSRQNNSR